MSLIFVDVEAHFDSPCPGIGGGMTEFGAVEFETRDTFHGIPRMDFDREFPAANEWQCTMFMFDEWLKKFPRNPIFMSDNNGYDWQWINYHFHHTLGRNPFGHSSRRISDIYTGCVKSMKDGTKWKKYRITKHDHNPVHDAMGNAEAFDKIINMWNIN